MKVRMFKKLLSSEAGYVLPLALILLVFGGLLVVPMLSLMATALNTNLVVEENDLELYSADAGIENVMWHILHDDDFTIPSEGAEYSFPQFEINGDTVDTSIKKNAGEYGYRITSTATSDDGESTTVESYYQALDAGWLLDSAITSLNDVEIAPNTTVSGNVTYNGTPKIQGTIDGYEITDPITWWPDTGWISDYYWFQVQYEPPFPSDTIDTTSGTEESPVSIGPLYREGNLTITGSGFARLDGTVYVTGDFKVMPGSTLDLNGQTVFAEGNIDLQPGCTISGSGCIIAIGNLSFQPNIEADPDDFLFLMSIEGDANIQPNGDLYGSVAGDCMVDLQPNCNLNWRAVGDGELNFPDGSDDDYGWRIGQILTYIIK